MKRYKLEKINNREKNFITTDKLSNIFPQVINKISGTRCAYLLTGTDLFDGVEIMIFGELHTENNKCSTCKENCINVIDIIEYTKKALYQQTIDFYLEYKYEPYSTNKFALFNASQIMATTSRIDTFVKNYVYLKQQNKRLSDNLRLHHADIRPELFMADKTISKNPNVRAYGTLDFLYRLTFESDIDKMFATDALYIDAQQVKVNIKSKLFDFDSYVDMTKNMYYEIHTNMNVVKNILRGENNELKKALKIDRQKEKFKNLFKNRKDAQKITDKVQEQINNICRKPYIDMALKTVERVDDMLGKLHKLTDIKLYVETLLTTLYVYKDNKYIDQSAVAYVMSSYMDEYTIFRMLRKLGKERQNNIIFYGGNAHANNIRNVLVATGYFKESVYGKTYKKEMDCQIITSH